MSFTNKITNLRIARKGTMMILLLLLSLVLPLFNFSSSNTLEINSISYQYITSAETPKLNLSYTYRTHLIDTPVRSGDVLAGDHVTLKAEWSPILTNRSKLEVYAPAIPAVLSVEENQSTLEIDTRALGNNATCIITATTWLANGSQLSYKFTDIYIGNYFVPKVTILSPNGNEDWTSVHNITWSVSDRNIDDEFLYDVLYSSDSGSSFETLVSATNLTWVEWDCSSLDRMDTYLVRVRVTDGIYYSSDISDNTFTAGTGITTTTTTTTTTTSTTTNTTPGLEPRIIAFVVILLFSSGVMALVVYFAARKWF
jgi:hypothetical protein